jgi:uncharacterized OsmC-like protein
MGQRYDVDEREQEDRSSEEDVGPDVVIGYQANRDAELEEFAFILDRLKEDPSLAIAKYRVNAVAGERSRVSIKVDRYALSHDKFRHSKPFTVNADSPAQLLGDDSAPNPTELLLAALGSSLVMAFMKLATLENLQLSRCEVHVKGKDELSAINFGGERASSQCGLRSLCAKFSIEGTDLDRGRLEELISKAKDASPVALTLDCAVDVCVCLKGDRELEERVSARATQDLPLGREEQRVPQSLELQRDQQQQQSAELPLEQKQVQVEEKVYHPPVTFAEAVKQGHLTEGAHDRGKRPVDASQEDVKAGHLEGYQSLEGVTFLKPSQPGVPLSEAATF